MSEYEAIKIILEEHFKWQKAIEDVYRNWFIICFLMICFIIIFN